MIKEMNFPIAVKMSDNALTGTGKAAISAVALAAILTVSGCTSNKIITPTDNSADYKSARALPPLRKPSDIAIEPTEAEVVVSSALEAPTKSVEPEKVIGSEDVIESVDIAEPADFVEAETRLEPEEVIEESNELVDSQISSEPDATENAAVAPSLLNEGNAVKMIVGSGFDQSWAYLTTQLAGSDVTVFSRNKAAGRVAIGCAEIGTETEVIQSGKWSIFNRKTKSASEYCSLQVSERKGSTIVSVLNRAGQEVPADQARSIINKILK